MSEPKNKPPSDPELDAAVLRVPYWRAAGLAAAVVVLAGPMLWYLAAVRGGGGTRADVDWLDGSEWRLVEIERRPVADAARVVFRDGQLVFEATGCPPQAVGYTTVPGDIRLAAPGAAPAACANRTVLEAWRRIPDVKGLTRYGTGLVLVDTDGRPLLKLLR